MVATSNFLAVAANGDDNHVSWRRTQVPNLHHSFTARFFAMVAPDRPRSPVARQRLDGRRLAPHGCLVQAGAIVPAASDCGECRAIPWFDGCRVCFASPRATLKKRRNAGSPFFGHHTALN